MVRKYHKKLVNAEKMVYIAYKNKYAIGQFNINNLEWTKTLLEAAQLSDTPIILGVSEGANKYMGGYYVVVSIINSLLDSLNITIPVALHLDHAQSVKSCKKAIDAGFSSVMYDGNNYSFQKNYKNTKNIIKYAIAHEVSVEAEIGSIGGEEDGIINNGKIANPIEAKKMVDLGISFLAAGIGNIHGLYPKNWTGLNFKVLKNIQNIVKIGMVLHGGSGIPKKQIQQAINLGISKINVNTELQIAFAMAIRKYIEAGKDKLDNNNKGFDPRKLLKPGYEAVKNTFNELINWFKCKGKGTIINQIIKKQKGGIKHDKKNI